MARNPLRPRSPGLVRPPPPRPPDPLLSVATRPLSSRAVVCEVAGEVDAHTASRLRDHLVERIRPGGPDLVVDLGGVRFLAAAGLGVLAEVAASADAAGVRIHVVARTRPVLLPLSLTGLDVVLDVHRYLGDVPLRGGMSDRMPRRSPVMSVRSGSSAT
ncbi:STAS domain-containing protein [Saccharothrix violaceirubra]|uniref:STAS domain-containing protein n=1 Tax=Saccharothrix violaceirubra TaxID=413306 RepID=UPI001C87B793|nr:STAS domain-containing protein [Saccharothrix violaceirubra]